MTNFSRGEPLGAGGLSVVNASAASGGSTLQFTVYRMLGLNENSQSATVKDYPVPVRSRSASPHPHPVALILSASVAGGHDAAARAIALELEEQGYQPIVADGLRACSRFLDWLMQNGYKSFLNYSPFLWGVTFYLTALRPVAALIKNVVGWWGGGRILRLVKLHEPDVVISTYPLLNAVLGNLRKRGRLTVPALASIADYGIHPLWVASGMDLHLLSSKLSAERCEQLGGRAAEASLPVAPGFKAEPRKLDARQELALPINEFIVLAMGGAWGIGSIRRTVALVAASGAFTVVVCGRNATLHARLARKFAGQDRVKILGWCSDMPQWLSAVDCLVQNAGGMTCLEAIRMRVPIVYFAPVPGHGRLNVQVMDQEHAGQWVHSAQSLGALLHAAVLGTTPIPAPQRNSAPGMAFFIENLTQHTSTSPDPTQPILRE